MNYTLKNEIKKLRNGFGDFLRVFAIATFFLVLYAVILMASLTLGLDDALAVLVSFAICFALYLVYWAVQQQRAGRNPLSEAKQKVQRGVNDTAASFRDLVVLAAWLALIAVCILVGILLIYGFFSLLAGLSATTVIIILLVIIALK